MAISGIFRILDARKARDLASPASSYLSIKKSDSLQKALFLMMEYEEDTLPVIDDEGKVLGDLILPEVLYWVFTYSHRIRDDKDS
jgi:CBS domain-containing protein